MTSRLADRNAVCAIKRLKPKTKNLNPASSPHEVKRETWDFKSKFLETTANMDTIKAMRLEVKKYIETADAKVIKMMYAMLEVDADSSWWDSLPDEIMTDVEVALAESEKGEVTAHAEIQKRYKNWVVR